MLQTRVDVVKAVQAMQQAVIQPFELGFTPFIEQHVLGTVCRAYRARFPKGKIHPRSSDTDDLLARLSTDELDAALVTLPLGSENFCIRQMRSFLSRLTPEDRRSASSRHETAPRRGRRTAIPANAGSRNADIATR